MPVVVSIWLSMAADFADGKLAQIGAVIGGDRKRRAGIELRHDLRQIVLGQREDHGDRLQLRDHGDAGRARRLHVISRIDQPQPDAAGDRRDDVAISEVERLRVDQALVLFHRAFVLLHDEDLIFGLLPRDRILRRERLVALEIQLRLRQQALVVRELAFILLFQDLIGPRIDLRQKIALLHHLAFGEGDVGEIAVDLRLHCDGRKRRHRAERIDDDADIAGGNRRCADRLQRARGIASAAWRGRAHPAHGLIGRKGEHERDDTKTDAEFGTGFGLLDRVRRRTTERRRQLVVRVARSLVHGAFDGP